jgi:hypothetical protein
MEVPAFSFLTLLVVSGRLPGLPSMQETDTCAGYALEAESTGNGRVADFFRGVQKIYVSVAEMADVVSHDRPRFAGCSKRR